MEERSFGVSFFVVIARIIFVACLVSERDLLGVSMNVVRVCIGLDICVSRFLKVMGELWIWVLA